jgi:hypothetical protein
VLVLAADGTGVAGRSVTPLADDIPAAAVRAIAVAIWRQVARDLASPSPDRRAPAVLWLESEQAVTWARRFDPAIDAELLVAALLVRRPTARVRHTRHHRLSVSCQQDGAG